MLTINPILAGATANFLIGWFWYTDYGFGPLLRKITGKKEDVSQKFYLRIVLEILSSIMLSTAFYIAILTFQKSQLVESQEIFTRLYAWFLSPSINDPELTSSLKIAGFVWLGFFFPNKLSSTVWSTEINWLQFFIKIGCDLTQYLAIGLTIAYFN